MDEDSVGDVSSRFRLRPVVVASVAMTGMVVFARVLTYPLVQDDWIRVEEALTTHPVALMLREFSPFGKVRYRPLGTLYFVFLGRILHLSALFSHLILLSMHVASALLVAAIVQRMSRHRTIGWASGVIYAGAAYIHLDSLIWAAGIFDGASIFLGLLALWLFVTHRSWAAAIAYASALLFKESVVLLPVVFWFVAWFDAEGSVTSRTRWAARRLLPLLPVLVVYAGVKIFGTSALSLDVGDPYAMRLWGPHLRRNAATYAVWSLTGLFPLVTPSARTAALVAAFGMVILIVGAVVRASKRDSERARVTLVLTVWYVTSVMLYLFMPNHVYRYYLEFSLPAFTALAVLALETVFEWLRLSGRQAAFALALFVTASVVSSFIYFRQLDARGADQPYTDGTNDLVRRAAVVREVRDTLGRLHPTLAPSTVLLFNGLEIWSFGKDSGPHLWYGDSTIRAFAVDDLAVRNGAWTLYDTNEAWLFPGPRSAPVVFDPRRVLLFDQTRDGLVERPFNSPEDIGRPAPGLPTSR